MALERARAMTLLANDLGIFVEEKQ